MQKTYDRPVADVSEAFVNPAIMSKFWFSQAAAGWKSAARLYGRWTISPCR